MKIKDMHDALVARLKEALPWALAVEAYPSLREAMDTPIVAIEYVDAEHTQQNATQQHTMNMRWYARVIVGNSLGEMVTAEHGIALALALSKLHALGDGCSPIKVVRESEDEFRQPLDGYFVRLVEFEFEAQFGRADGLMGAAASEADAANAEMQAWLAGDVVGMRIGHEACPLQIHDSQPMQVVL